MTALGRYLAGVAARGGEVGARGLVTTAGAGAGAGAQGRGDQHLGPGTDNPGTAVTVQGLVRLSDNHTTGGCRPTALALDCIALRYTTLYYTSLRCTALYLP